MAKNKKKKNNKNGKQQSLSPARFMSEKARNLPLGKCYLAPVDWKEEGITNVIVTRERPNGNLVMANFLVDTFCLGVKDAIYKVNLDKDEFDGYLEHLEDETGVGEVSYNEAHNLIYGAIEFAEEAGIPPAKDFSPACYILEEDTDEIPLIEYEYGKDGKYVLVVGPDRKEMVWFNTLQERLGDKFDYIMPVDMEYEYYDDDDDEEYDDDDYDDEYGDDKDALLPELTEEKMDEVFKKMLEGMKETQRHPREPFSHVYPAYPKTPEVKNQFIADALLSSDNLSSLPRDVIERILALPKDEAAGDISNVMLYEIGRTYNPINNGSANTWDNSAIMHALVLLARVGNGKALDAVLELMSQSDDFVAHHLGDLEFEIVTPALYACGNDNVERIERYLNEPGHDSFLRAQALDVLAEIAILNPERRDEIIGVFRRLLSSMVSRLPVQHACDGVFAGMFMGVLIEIGAKELIPEIKAVFATDCVDKNNAGDCEKVVGKIEIPIRSVNTAKYDLPDIYEQYEEFKSFIKEPE